MASLSDMLVYLRKREGFSQQELADKLGMTRSAIGMYETGKREPDLETLEAFADFYNVDMNTLTGRHNAQALPANIIPLPKMKKVPLVGQIACGTPILAEQNVTDYVDLPTHIHADYALTCKGDSMVNIGISDGDIVYIREQTEVENGQIAAVMVGDEEATLKRFYYQDDMIQLVAENSSYPPKIFVGDAISQIRIVGRAVAFTHVIE
mgnify:CR=1 FL=1